MRRIDKVGNEWDKLQKKRKIRFCGNFILDNERERQGENWEGR